MAPSWARTPLSHISLKRRLHPPMPQKNEQVFFRCFSNSWIGALLFAQPGWRSRVSPPLLGNHHKGTPPDTGTSPNAPAKSCRSPNSRNGSSSTRSSPTTACVGGFSGAPSAAPWEALENNSAPHFLVLVKLRGRINTMSSSRGHALVHQICKHRSRSALPATPLKQH